MILKNFEHFSTPCTSGRPGTVYRIDISGKKFIVEGVKLDFPFEIRKSFEEPRRIFHLEKGSIGFFVG